MPRLCDGVAGAASGELLIRVLEDRRQQLEDVGGGSRPRIRLRTRAGGSGRRELREIFCRDAERCERREAGEARELLRTLGRTTAEQPVRGELLVEPERR